MEVGLIIHSHNSLIHHYYASYATDAIGLCRKAIHDARGDEGLLESKPLQGIRGPWPVNYALEREAVCNGARDQRIHVETTLTRTCINWFMPAIMLEGGAYARNIYRRLLLRLWEEGELK